MTIFGAELFCFQSLSHLLSSCKTVFWCGRKKLSMTQEPGDKWSCKCLSDLYSFTCRGANDPCPWEWLYAHNRGAAKSTSVILPNSIKSSGEKKTQSKKFSYMIIPYKSQCKSNVMRHQRTWHSGAPPSVCGICNK